jgi:putative transcriptional regulator
VSKGKGATGGKGAIKGGAKGEKAPPKDAKPSLADRLVAGLASVVEALESGEPIEKRLTVRTVKLDFTPRVYTPGDVKAVREKTGASQAVFAKFLGVSVQALRHWEQGTRQVPTLAARFLDEIDADPGIWTRRLQSAAK